MKAIILATLAVNALLMSPVFASEGCSVPDAEWQKPEALQAKLEGQGWTVKSIKTEDGCYEAYAIDAKGSRVEASFDPKTFEPLGGGDEDAGGGDED